MRENDVSPKKRKTIRRNYAKEPIVNSELKKYNTWNKNTLEGLNGRFGVIKEPVHLKTGQVND